LISAAYNGLIIKFPHGEVYLDMSTHLTSPSLADIISCGDIDELVDRFIIDVISTQLNFKCLW